MVIARFLAMYMQEEMGFLKVFAYRHLLAIHILYGQSIIYHFFEFQLQVVYFFPLDTAKYLEKIIYVLFILHQTLDHHDLSFDAIMLHISHLAYRVNLLDRLTANFVVIVHEMLQEV